MLRDLVNLYQFKKNIWKSLNELEDIQNKKLKAIVNHAYQNVLFYREAFKKRDLHPDDIETVHDLVKLPIIEKKDIQQRPLDFLAKNYEINQCRKTHTSGSTGIPLTLYTDKIGESYNRTVNLRAMMENGLHLTHKVMEITHPENFSQKTLFRWMGIYRKECLSVYDAPEINVKKFIEYCPDILMGYPSVLSLMADYITQNNIKITFPEKIFTSAEMLYDTVRKKIASTFGCDIIDIYGCTEFRRLAWECSKHEGYHTDIDFSVVEIIKDTAVECEYGSLIITGLHNYAMPLLRYRNGDAARALKYTCSCGRGLPLIEKILGRIDDKITLPSGRVVSPRSINVLDYTVGINQYRIIQEEKGLFIVQIEKNDQFSEKTLHEIKEQIQKGCLNEHVMIQVEEVEKIQREKSGKIRTVISRVKQKDTN